MATLATVRAVILRKVVTSSSYGEYMRAQSKTLATYAKTLKPHKTRRSIAIGIALGVGLGSAYSYYKLDQINGPQTAILNSGMGTGCKVLKKFPEVMISRKITYPTDSSDLKITLFQYPTCPFCCKVRAFLDYHGLSYDVVEVNPVLRQQLKWSSDYRKVPILLIKIDEGYLQLNDSSMIISTLTSYLHEKEISLLQVANYYPSIKFVDSDGVAKSEILNRYFLMYQGSLPDGSSKESILEERKWRKWADDVLVHTLSPNVYRSTTEALESFQWFSKVGDWETLFPSWERNLIIYIGSMAMWLIGKRLKKKHQLKDDVRISLYDDTNVWLKELRRKGTQFHGGSKPDLADLAVYGVLSSIEGCTAFRDLLQNTKVSTWYSDVKTHVMNHFRGEALAAT